MRRRLCLLAILARTLTADPRDEIYDVLGSMANGLGEGNVVQFLEPFDQSMKGYAELEANVRALVVQMELSSTIELVDDAGDAQRHTVHVDWLLQLRDKEDRASGVRRQKTIEIRLEKQKRKWRIVWLAPLDFFAPHPAGHP